MAPPIPDRWLDYKPVGKKIEGTRFIAFKVPLRENIVRNVELENRLDGKMLLSMLPNLGLIIDLTNTYRYYDPTFFENEGIKYVKLMIPGKETPPTYLVNKFHSFVEEFIKNNTNNDKLIGVHCTHGVNRTGFLICNYMISQMTIDPNQAINSFADARGHKIERTNYLDALHKLLESNEQKSSLESTDRKLKLENWREREIPKPKEENWREWKTVGNQKKERRYDRDYIESANRRYNNNTRFRNRADIRDDCNSRFRATHDQPPRTVDYSSYYQRNHSEESRNYNSHRSIGQSDTPRYYNDNPHQPRLRTDYYSSRPLNRH